MTGGNKWRLLVFCCQTSGATACSGRDFKLFFENLRCCNCCHKGWRSPCIDADGSVIVKERGPRGDGTVEREDVLSVIQDLPVNREMQQP